MQPDTRSGYKYLDIPPTLGGPGWEERRRREDAASRRAVAARTGALAVHGVSEPPAPRWRAAAVERVLTFILGTTMILLALGLSALVCGWVLVWVLEVWSELL